MEHSRKWGLWMVSCFGDHPGVRCVVTKAEPVYPPVNLTPSEFPGAKLLKKRSAIPLPACPWSMAESGKSMPIHRRSLKYDVGNCRKNWCVWFRYARQPAGPIVSRLVPSYAHVAGPNKTISENIVNTGRRRLNDSFWAQIKSLTWRQGFHKLLDSFAHSWKHLWINTGPPSYKKNFFNFEITELGWIRSGKLKAVNMYEMSTQLDLTKTLKDTSDSKTRSGLRTLIPYSVRASWYCTIGQN